MFNMADQLLCKCSLRGIVPVYLFVNQIIEKYEEYLCGETAVGGNIAGSFPFSICFGR